MADEPAAVLESPTEGSTALRVEFLKCGDRFSHIISLVESGRVTPLLDSIEGSPEDFSPLSPPIAEIHQQDKMLFLTGATSIGHWSISLQADAGLLVFDVACRLKKEPTFLGNSYRILNEVFELRPMENSQVVRKGEELIIQLKNASPTSFPATVRWQYGVESK